MIDRQRIPDAVEAEIKAAINANPMPIADRYFAVGRKRKRSAAGREARWEGKRGGLKVGLSSQHRGLFSDFEAGWAGDGLGVLRLSLGCSFNEALRVAADLYGISVPDQLTDDERRRHQANEAALRAATAAPDIKAQQEDAQAIGRAQALASEAVAITEGDPADRYLARFRNIPRPPLGWPECLRFLPRKSGAPLSDGRECDALLVIATDDAGSIVATQHIKLDPSQPKGRKGGKLGKITTGRPGRGFVRIPSGGQKSGLPTNAVAIAEGVETGLSVSASTGCAVLVTTGTRRIDSLPGSGTVLLCRDDDPEFDKNGKPHPAFAGAEGNRDRIRASGRAVLDIWPWSDRRQDGSDFNDVLLAHGPAGVLARVRGSIPASLPAQLPTADECSLRVGELVADFLDRTISDDEEAPPSALVRVGVGIGKTTAALREALARYEHGAPLVISVPEHGLAADMRERVEAIRPDLTAHVWRGRSQPGMCGNLEDVEAIQTAGLGVMETLCRRNCPFQNGCAYLEQMEQKADVWIVPHALLFLARPAAIGTPSLLIIDEQFWTNALIGTGSDIGRPIESLTIPDAFWNAFKWNSAREVLERNGRLKMMLERIAARYSQGEGSLNLTKADATEAHFTADNLDYGLQQTSEVMGWVLTKKADMESIRRWGPTMKALARMCALLREMRRLFDQDGEETPRITAWMDDAGVYRYRLMGCRQIDEGWRARTLMLDATANPEAIRHFFPEVEVSEPFQAATPHARHIWARGLSWGKRAQQGAVEAHIGEAEAKERGATVDAIRFGQWERFLQTGGAGLAVCNKVMSEYVRTLGGSFLPPGHDIRHFGTLAGLNDYEDAATIDIYGRTLPNVEAVERASQALTGRPLSIGEYEEGCGVQVTNLPNGTTIKRFVAIDTDRALPDGSIVSVPVFRHPDPMANSVLQEILEGGLIQSAGRGRSVRRTAETPLEIRIHADTYPTGLPLDAIEDLAPASPYARMAAQGTGLVALSATDAARVYPHLWATPKAAERAFAKSIHRPPKVLDYYIKGFGGSVALTYQPAGPRLKPRQAIIIGGDIDRARRLLEGALGSLAAFRIEGTPGQDSASARPAPAEREMRRPPADPAPGGLPEFYWRPEYERAQPVQVMATSIPTMAGEEGTAIPLPDPDVIPIRTTFTPQWRVGGISEWVNLSETGIERATGHSMGAEDESSDPALVWVGAARLSPLDALEQKYLWQSML